MLLPLEKKKTKFFKRPDDKYEKVYLIHHMHHFEWPGKKVEHALHHCFLFSKKNMKGKKYTIIHQVYKGNVYHCISEKFIGKLYDHTNKVFNIICRNINNREVYEIQF